MHLYEVRAKCGHVGKGYYVEKNFAVKAKSAKDAAAKVRMFPRVKHHHKDAIRYVIEIDEIRFNEIMSQNSSDPYFRCKNIQEQKQQCELVVFTELYDSNVFDKKEATSQTVYYGKKALRSPKKYINNYLDEQRNVI